MEELQEHTNKKSPKRKLAKKKPKYKPFQNLSKDKDMLKFSYADLKLPSPKEFNYDNYNRDWCRYCGARFSSNFTKGPWGPRTLCTVHYIAWG